MVFFKMKVRVMGVINGGVQLGSLMNTRDEYTCIHIGSDLKVPRDHPHHPRLMRKGEVVDSLDAGVYLHESCGFSTPGPPSCAKEGAPPNRPAQRGVGLWGT